MNIQDKIEKYLVNDGVVSNKRFNCIGGGNNKNCYWEGDKPVKSKKGKYSCPVCGGDVEKN